MYIRTVLFFPIVLFALVVCAGIGTTLRKRLPSLMTMARVLLPGVAAIASFLVGFGVLGWHPLTVVLPLVISASLTLIWDLDHPRSGLVRVRQDSMHRAEAAVMGAAD